MILSRLVVRWLEIIIEIGLWLILIFGFIGGTTLGSGFLGSLGMGLAIMFAGGLFASVLFGFFILLNSINRSVTRAVSIAESREATK